jgi:hypothetical protein
VKRNNSSCKKNSIETNSYVSIVAAAPKVVKLPEAGKVFFCDFYNITVEFINSFISV